MKARLLTALAAACLMASGVAHAATTTDNRAPVPVPTPAGPPPAPVPGVDTRFAIAAMQGNHAEIDEAMLAVARGASPQIMGYARKMIDEHHDMAASLDPALVRKLAHVAPPRLANADQLTVEYLRSIPLVDFDQQYAMSQVQGHLATLTAFQTETRDGSDPALKALAAKWTPTVRAHLQLAVDLANHASGDSPFHSQ